MYLDKSHLLPAWRPIKSENLIHFAIQHILIWGGKTTHKLGNPQRNIKNEKETPEKLIFFHEN